MLNLTRRTDYALVALTHLQRIGPEDSASAREIAETYQLPRALLMNILKQLCNGGLVRSARGASGGYRFEADPQTISLLDVVTTIEGPVKVIECATDEAGDADVGGGPYIGCGRETICPITEPMRRLHGQIRELLRRTTLADLIHNRDRIGLTPTPTAAKPLAAKPGTCGGACPGPAPIGTRKRNNGHG